MILLPFHLDDPMPPLEPVEENQKRVFEALQKLGLPKRMCHPSYFKILEDRCSDLHKAKEKLDRKRYMIIHRALESGRWLPQGLMKSWTIAHAESVELEQAIVDTRRTLGQQHPVQAHIQHCAALVSAIHLHYTRSRCELARCKKDFVATYINIHIGVDQWVSGTEAMKLKHPAFAAACEEVETCEYVSFCKCLSHEGNGIFKPKAMVSWAERYLKKNPLPPCPL